MHWEQQDTLIIGQTDNLLHTNKIASFDLDGTLIIPKNNHKYVQNENDWLYTFNTVKDYLTKLTQHDFQVVIFTNQGGIKLIGVDRFKQLITNIINDLNIPILIYVATGYDLYRKPFPTMWEFFVKNITIDYHKTFYCGDACGRETDFSDSDYKFSLNCNINFITPENLFLNKNTYYPILKNTMNFQKFLIDRNAPLTFNKKEIVVLVGNYASGKTHLAQTYFVPHKYIINTDTNIDFKYKRIVIDANNWTIKSRKKYIQLATEHDYSIRCIFIICPAYLCKHNSLYHHYISNGITKIINDKFICDYRDEFEYPTVDEGFDEVINYYFTIDKSINLSKYCRYLL